VNGETANRYERSAQLEKHLRDFRSKELNQRTPVALSRLIRDLLPRICIFTLSYVLMLAPPMPWSGLGAVLFSVANVSLLGSWFHDGVHRNPTRARSLGELIAYLAAAPVGFSVSWWRYKHVRLHHSHPSDPRFDPDIQFGLIGRVSSVQQWHPIHRTQHVHMWLLMPLSTLAMLKPSEIWQSRKFSFQTGLHPKRSAYFYLLQRYASLGVVWVPVFTAQSVKHATILFLIFSLLTGSLVSLITQIQHNTDLSDDSPKFSDEFPLCEQLARSTDVAIGRGIWWWICGGVNLHVVHHLAPSVSFLELPEITERLSGHLASCGITIPSHPRLTDAVMSHARLIRKLSRENIAAMADLDYAR
jgi:linoleoyl-CoA desaturase